MDYVYDNWGNLASIAGLLSTIIGLGVAVWQVNWVLVHFGLFGIPTLRVPLRFLDARCRMQSDSPKEEIWKARY